MSQSSDVFYINVNDEEADLSCIAHEVMIGIISNEDIPRKVYETGYKRGYINATKNAAALLHQQNEEFAKITHSNMKEHID